MYFVFENRSKPFYAEKVSRRLSATPHLHNHIELILIHSYGEAICYADDKNVLLKPGDLFISFPNQIHYFINQTISVDYSILIVSPDMCPEFNPIFKTKLPRTPILKQAGQNTRLVSALQTLVDCGSAAAPQEYAEPLARGSALVLFSELFKNLELTDHISTGADYAKDIIQYCYQNYDGDISLQSIADALHISRYYISHLFSRRLRIGFNDYINHLRISKACELLKSGHLSVTEIAYAVGYNSTRSFDRCFSAIKGTTPKAYRARALEKNQQK